MKQLLSMVCFVLLSGWALSQGVKISDTPGSPDASSILDVESTYQGFLPPRMSTAQRNLIADPAVGLTIYNTDKDCLESYRSFGWRSYCPGLPEVQTSLISQVSRTVIVEGLIVHDGDDFVLDKGLCWSQQSGPTLSDSTLSLGSGIDPFSAQLPLLQFSTTYYVRSYATTNVGTAYGNELEVTTDAGTLVSFTSPGSHDWTVPEGVTNVEVLIVAGGGGGGASDGNTTGGHYNGGGGGAGGLIHVQHHTLSNSGSVALYVGNGGNGVDVGNGSDGENSLFDGLTAFGGGGGGGYGSPGNNGGSGGGSGRDNSSPGLAAPGQGNDGGTGDSGGGGGAGTAGDGINGGAGLAKSITGSPIYYAGGGGGSGSGSEGGAGGIGGGGNGRNSLDHPGDGENGEPNTGGGGGAAGMGYFSGSGGSGVIYIRY